MFQRSSYPFSTRLAHLLIISLFFVATPEVAAQDGEPRDPAIGDATVGVQGGRYGVGFASSWPAYGVSGTLQISETLTAEAVLGFLGAVSNFSGRAWYRFKRDPSYDLYGYGGAGVYRYGYFGGTENVLGLGGGVGVEAGLQSLLDDEDLPPIFLNAEFGLAYANFDFYNFSSFTFGSGIHYRFGGN